MSVEEHTDDRYVTAAEAAEFFGVSPATIYRWVNTGLLVATAKSGSAQRFSEHSMRAVRDGRDQSWGP